MKIKFNHCFAILIGLFILTTGLTTWAADRINLKKQDITDNTPFNVGNMFPGDSETKDYVVDVHHNDKTSLYFHADVRKGYEKLSEVMMIKVYLPEKDIVLYDGLMADMPNSVEYMLDENEDSILYRITAYLHTSVGNEYQNKQLVSDFSWWYMEENQEDNRPGGNYPGGGFPGGSTGPIAPGTPPNVVKPDDEGQNVPSTDAPDKKDYVTVKIIAENVLDGEYPRGNDFKYTLQSEDDNTIQTVTNKDGHIEFDSLIFEQEGIYKYHIISEGSGQDHIMHDNSVCEVVVTVKKVDGKLTAEVVYI